MKANTWRTGAVLLSILAVVAVLGWAQGAVAPKGIITTPPDSELEVRIWVDNGAYALGEAITIRYSVNKPAYIYIWDIQPDGIANQLFPYPSSSSPNNFVQAGEHTLAPPPGSSGWIIAPPTGTEYLQILATTSPVQPFAYMSPDPQVFQQSIEAQVLGILPAEERSWDFTSFEIVSGTPVSYGIITVNSSPSGALITIDGDYAGYTPRTMFVEQGFHRISVTKSGYTGWNAAIFTIGGLTRTINVTLEPLVAVNEPPVALFTYSPPSPGLGEWISFDATASVDPDGSIASYSWNFGDGTSSAGAVAWHRFSTPGTYQVTLTVQDNNGVSDSTSQMVQVGSLNQSPTAAFAFSPTNPAVGAWVQFDGSTSSDPDGSIAAYSWNFGDGSNGSGAVAWHQFSSPGTYQVTLTVQDDDGATDSTSHSIMVGTAALPPVAAFTYAPSSPTVGQAVLLNGQPSYDPDGSIVTYLWDLDGDGSDDMSGSLGQVTYQSVGTVLVRLTVIDDDGLSATTTQAIAVSSGGGGVPIGGTPPMGSTPGLFVWGSDSWHITVNAGLGWGAARAYRIELRTDGTFEEVEQPVAASQGAPVSAAPMGVIPTPTFGGKTLIFEGSILNGQIDHAFRIPDSQSMWLSLQLDIDGDGDLDTSPSFVYLRYSMVNPPTSPFVVGLPSGSGAELLPGLNFRIGNAISYTETTRFVYWTTTISNLEGP